MKNVRDMDIAEVEEEIAGRYRWFAKGAPGVTPKEVGRLGELWKRADYLYRDEASAVSPWKEGK